MTGFTILAALLAALAAAFVLVPLLRRRSHHEASRLEANASIYREQLAELEAERERGAITQEEFMRASREVERRVVAEVAVADARKPVSRVRPAMVAIVIGLLVPLFAGLAYWRLGTPGAIGLDPQQAAAHSVTQDQMAELVERLSARMEQTPNDVEGWMLLGRSLAVLGRYEDSARAYARAAALVPKDAGLLADYADALAMARGQKLAGEPFEIVKRALEIDPQHIKALALAGSAEFERHDFKAAIAYWERILKVVPPESEFGRSVSESIAEARSRQGSGSSPVAQAPAAEAKKPAAAAKPPGAEKKKSAAQSLQGTVTLDPAVAARASKDDTVFVLARPASGSRMPLAIARTTVGSLPYRFALDDSMAMAAGATISSQAQVVVVARVSKSGSAAPQKGDLEGASAPVAPGASGLTVVISRVID